MATHRVRCTRAQRTVCTLQSPTIQLKAWSSLHESESGGHRKAKGSVLEAEESALEAPRWNFNFQGETEDWSSSKEVSLPPFPSYMILEQCSIGRAFHTQNYVSQISWALLTQVDRINQLPQLLRNKNYAIKLMNKTDEQIEKTEGNFKRSG